MLEQRSQEIEIMDDLEISGGVVNQTLRELNTINKFLGGNQISVSAFKTMSPGNENIVFADLGCGGGDIMIEMAKWAKKKKMNVEFLGIDANPNIVQFAESNSIGYPEIHYKSVNILGEEFRNLKADIIHCCLFVHHFSKSELIRLFRQFKEQARLGVIINDLHRHPIAYLSIKLLTRLFSKSAMVRNDAAISVARGFKRNELIVILKEAGITEYKLSWHWAFRWKLIF